MLADELGGSVVSSLSWVDHAGLWVFRSAGGAAETVVLSDARYVSLHGGRRDFFSVVHHFDADRIEVTVHHFAEPAEAISRASLDSSATRVAGDASAWDNVQTHYVAYYAGPVWSDFALVRVKPAEGQIELQQFDWYTDGYDKGYQGIVGVTEVPGADLLIVSVQRDSRPILYDPVARTKVGALELCGRGGNPKLFFRRHAQELWADDYDTIVKIEPHTWRILGSRILQGAAAGAMQFIGAYAFDADETRCIVARPFSGDVLSLSPRSLRPRFRCRLDGQPLEAVALADGSIVARDWKSGALLRGELRRMWTF